MKRLLLYIILCGTTLLAPALAADGDAASLRPASAADRDCCGLPVAAATLKRNAGLFSVAMQMRLADLDLHGDRAAVFTPLLVHGADTLRLPAVGLYGRTRWYQYLRAGERPLGGPGEQAIRYADRPDALAYSQTFAYADWMDGARLLLLRRDYGCCRQLIDSCDALLGLWRQVIYRPAFRYVTPVAEAVKARALAGRAYIDFPVNRTEIRPDYRNNPVELAKIIATIDSVRSDKDVTVQRITIKGWASPESSWANNTRLAKGRTATLRQYVQNLYRFPDGFIQTDYEPEDWPGLRAFVAASNLEHRDQILAIIDDTTLEPDPKEAKIKRTYPEEYRFLLATVYPGLRHSDYTIEYTIRPFSSIDEIRAVMATAPQKLSLGEFFLLAQALEPGIDDYNEVFETAVRMYPTDPTANLNAANAAMQRADLDRAARYLDRAGDTPEAVYARAVLAALRGDYATAVRLVEAAAQAGMTDTADVLTHLREVMEESDAAK